MITYTYSIGNTFCKPVNEELSIVLIAVSALLHSIVLSDPGGSSIVCTIA